MNILKTKSNYCSAKSVIRFQYLGTNFGLFFKQKFQSIKNEFFDFFLYIIFFLINNSFFLKRKLLQFIKKLVIYFYFFLLFIIFIKGIYGWFLIFDNIFNSIALKLMNSSVCYCQDIIEEMPIPINIMPEAIMPQGISDIDINLLFNNLPSDNLNEIKNSIIISEEELNLFMEENNESSYSFASIELLLNKRDENLKMFDCLSINSILGIDFKIKNSSILIQNLCEESDYLYNDSLKIMESFRDFSADETWYESFAYILDNIFFSNQKMLFLSDNIFNKVIHSYSLHINEINIKKVLLFHSIQQPELIDLIFNEYLYENNSGLINKYLKINKNLYTFFKIFNLNLGYQLDYLNRFLESDVTLMNLEIVTNSPYFSQYSDVFLLNNQSNYSIENLNLDYPNLLNNDIYYNLNYLNSDSDLSLSVRNSDSDLSLSVRNSDSDLSLSVRNSDSDLSLSVRNSDSDLSLSVRNSDSVADSEAEDLHDLVELLDTLHLISNVDNTTLISEYLPITQKESDDFREKYILIVEDPTLDTVNDYPRFQSFFHKINSINLNFTQKGGDDINSDLALNIKKKGFLINSNQEAIQYGLKSTIIRRL